MAPEPSALIPILQIMSQVSSAFTPLQSAVEGLLGVIDSVEVRLSPSQSHSTSLVIGFGGQKAAQNTNDIEELKSSLSDLVSVFQRPPLNNAATWSPALRNRVEDLSRLARFYVLHCLLKV